MTLQLLKKKFLAHSIPESIKQSNDFGLIIRARVLAALYVSNIIICCLLIVFFIGATLFTQNNFMPSLIITLGAIMLLSLQLYSFYTASNVKACATFFSMTFFALSFGGVILSGGWHSPMLILFFCAPAISFLVGGSKQGFYMSALVYICGALLMLAYHSGFQIFNINLDAKIEWVRFYAWIIATITLVSCLTVYDSLLNSLKKQRSH